MAKSAATASSRYRVRAIRSGDWWAIEFPDVDDRIHSQARRLEQVPAMAADAITMWYADEDERRVSPDDIDVQAVLPDELEEVLRRARLEREHAAAAAATAAAAFSDAVTAVTNAGLPTRDAGHLLGVSHQYAAKVGAAAKART